MELSAEQLEQRIKSYPDWFYNFNLNGIETSPDAVLRNRRHELRKELFFDPLIDASVFSGKRVLDIGCCSGFWSFHALESGAEYVLGVDAWPQAIDQAKFVASVQNIDSNRCEFILEDIFTFLSDAKLKDSFDIVLCLGFMYHVKRPIELLEKIHNVGRDLLILETTVFDIDDAAISLRPDAGKASYVETARDRLTFVPSEKAIHWMMKEVGFQCATIKHSFSSTEKSVSDYVNRRRMAFACSKKTDASSILSQLDDKPEEAPETLLEFLEEYHQIKHKEKHKEKHDKIRIENLEKEVLRLQEYEKLYKKLISSSRLSRQRWKRA